MHTLKYKREDNHIDPAPRRQTNRTHSVQTAFTSNSIYAVFLYLQPSAAHKSSHLFSKPRRELHDLILTLFIVPDILIMTAAHLGQTLCLLHQQLDKLSIKDDSKI